MGKSERADVLQVDLQGLSYPIYFGHKLLQQPDLLNQYLSNRQILVVTNETVAPLYLSSFLNAIHSSQCHSVVLPDGESFKNQDSLDKIYQYLIDNTFHRDCLLVSLGGGVIGDLTGFAASCFQRGVDFIQIPTTLLAQVDASVGGKTAINFGQVKNMIGSFYQPKAVFIDFNVLNTLPQREFRAGLAEVIKSALIQDEPFYRWLCQNSHSLSDKYLHQMVKKCCAIKASIVEQDEKETGVRALLNLGHTFAHALEAVTHYRRWLHGEAVAIGLVCAALLSYQKQLLEGEEVLGVVSLLEQVGLPIQIPYDIDLQQIVALMNYDKKVMANKKRFILIQEIGVGVMVDDIMQEEIIGVLKACTNINDIKRRLR